MALVKMSKKEVGPYLEDLQKRVEARWEKTVEKTRFMRELDSGKLPLKTIQVFYTNWGAFVPVINSLYTVQFYKHLAFFVSNVDLMETYTHKVLDEFGHPAPPGHIKILISSGEALGLTEEQILTQPMMPEARGLTDFHRTLVNDGPMHEYWASVLWEGAFGLSCLRWFKALTKHYKLTAEQADYFHKHHEADTMDHLGREAHSSVTKHVLRRILTEGIVERPGYPFEYCAMTPVDLYCQMLDAVYDKARSARA
jgi:pyrroloquinoline quinone (PQQ) biosynthesis protein C